MEELEQRTPCLLRRRLAEQWSSPQVPRQSRKKPVPAPPAPKSLPEDVQNVVKNWHNVLNRLHPLLRTYLKDAQLKAVGDGDSLASSLATPTGEAFLKETRQHLQEIRNVILNRIPERIWRFW